MEYACRGVGLTEHWKFVIRNLGLTGGKETNEENSLRYTVKGNYSHIVDETHESAKKENRISKITVQLFSSMKWWQVAN